MTPNLEAIVFAAPTVSFRVYEISKDLPEEERLFEKEALNNCVIFKYPNFDTASENLAAIPGLEDLTPGKSVLPVRTGIFLPKDQTDPRLGGYGIFTDQPDFDELLKRHAGLDGKEEEESRDYQIIKILSQTPSLDPFIISESFGAFGLKVNPAYLTIADKDTANIRAIITAKVMPVVQRAFEMTNDDAVSQKSRKFVDAIWDPTLSEARLFIQAFGIKADDAPEVFGAWKGVAFFQNEFSQNRALVDKFEKWLDSDRAKPKDWQSLTSDEKQQIEMFRSSLRQRVRTLRRNVDDIFILYENSYLKFLDEDDPRYFRDFLFKANQYYWTLGACGGVLEQVVMTWRRYFSRADSTGRLTFDLLERLFKVCESILKSRAEEQRPSL